MQTHIDLRVEEKDGKLAVRTAYQAPSVIASGVLPFTASDGTVVDASPSGIPFVTAGNGKVTVFLRTDKCPLPLWDRALLSPVGAADTRQAARATKAAVSELRQKLRCARRAECNKAATGGDQ